MIEQQNREEPAAIWLRATNYIIDSLLSHSFSIAATIYIVFPLALTGVQVGGAPVVSYLFYASILVFCRTMYYVVFEYFFSKTPAKFLTRTIVASTAETSSLRQLYVRSFARLIPFNEFSIFRKSRTTWHDDLGKSVVIKGKAKRFTASKHYSMYAIAALFILSIVLTAYLFFFAGAKQFSGELKLGALKVPTNLPRDVRVVDVVEKKDNISYYEIFYRGTDLEFTYSERTAGYQFNPGDNCLLMTSTGVSQESEGVFIPAGLRCEMLDEFRSVGDVRGIVRVFGIQATEGFPATRLSEVPEYYIAFAPHRYAIDVSRGELSEKEVLDMAKSLTKLYPEEIGPI